MATASTLYGSNVTGTTLSRTFLSVTPASTTGGDPMTMTVLVADDSGAGGSPSGTVTLLDGRTPLTDVTIVGGTAEFVTSNLSVGRHTITATYGGDSTLAPSTSSSADVTVAGYWTVTTIAPSTGAAKAGDPLALSATVVRALDGQHPAGGTVQFMDGLDTINSAVGIDQQGVATLTTNSLSTGFHTIRAVYSGDTENAPSTSDSNVQVVYGNSTTTLTSSSNPMALGGTVTLTSTTTGDKPPTGTVHFWEGETDLGSRTVDPATGSATFDVTNPTQGTHSYTASYGDDRYNDVSTSLPLSQVVKAQTATFLTSSSGRNPSTYGTPVTFTATTSTVAPGTGTPSGTVTFSAEGTVLGTAPLDGNGVASFTTSSLSLGYGRISAVYAGDADHMPASSSMFHPVFLGTHTKLTSSTNPAAVGDNVTLTATMTPDPGPNLRPVGLIADQAKAQALTEAGTNIAIPPFPIIIPIIPMPLPMGGVVISDGDTVVTMVPVDSSFKATWTPPALLTRGAHNFKAQFTGTFGLMPSVDTLTQAVQTGSTTVLTSSPTPADFATPVTLTAKVASVVPEGGVPTGAVAFKDGDTVIGSSPVDGTGKAELVTSSLTVGAHTLSAAYEGDGGNAVSVSSPVAQVIKPAAAKSSGYWLAGADGGVFGFGSAPFLGSAVGLRPNQPVVGSATTPDRKGYWLVSSDGGVFSFGDASYFGSLGGMKLNAPIVGMAATSTGHGYWLFAKDGGVFAFGDATYAGSLGRTALKAPIVGGAAAGKSGGYWLTAADGGVFAFGGAPFKGSAAGMALRAPVVGMSSTADGLGYWLVAADGGVFSYGTAPFKGSAAGVSLTKPVVGITRDQSGGGYWLTSADGGVFGYGDAAFFGSGRTVPLRTDVVGVMPSA